MEEKVTNVVEELVATNPESDIMPVEFVDECGIDGRSALIGGVVVLGVGVAAYLVTKKVIPWVKGHFKKKDIIDTDCKEEETNEEDD